jgi:hypothetical protein
VAGIICLGEAGNGKNGRHAGTLWLTGRHQLYITQRMVRLNEQNCY